MVTASPKFLPGLALAVFGLTILALFALEAWTRGAARLPEQASPDRLALAGLGVITLVPGILLLRAAWRSRQGMSSR